jgi:hypothetical protein
MRARRICVAGSGADGCGGISQPHNEHGGRRPPAPTEILGDPEPRGRDGAVGARQRDRQYRIAGDREGNPRQRRRFDLGHQRLPAGGRHFAAAVRLARRHFRLPPHLHDWPRRVHRRGARQCAVALLADADLRPRAAGAGCCRHDERQYRARAIHLSAAAVGARHCDGLGRRIDIIGGGPERRRGDSRRRVVALALRDQCPDRGCRSRDVVAPLADDAALRLSLRPGERGVVRS